jgi:hypothetical protein
MELANATCVTTSTLTKLSGDFVDTLFDKSELSHSTITGNYDKCSFVRADFRHADVIDVTFMNCNFKLIDGCYSTWTNCKFTNCDMHGADFSRSEFINCEFDNTDILPTHTVLDLYTTMNQCIIKNIYIKSDLDYTKSLACYDKSIYKTICNAVLNVCVEVCEFIKQELNSERAHDLMKYLFKNITLGWKTHSKHDGNLVKLACDNDEAFYMVDINTLKNSYCNMYTLANSIKYMFNYSIRIVNILNVDSNFIIKYTEEKEIKKMVIDVFSCN